MLAWLIFAGLVTISNWIILYLQTGTPEVTDINVCFGLDLRPGYENHYYAYVMWNYTDNIGRHSSFTSHYLTIGTIFVVIVCLYIKPIM